QSERGMRSLAAMLYDGANAHVVGTNSVAHKMVVQSNVACPYSIASCLQAQNSESNSTTLISRIKRQSVSAGGNDAENPRFHSQLKRRAINQITIPTTTITRTTPVHTPALKISPITWQPVRATGEVRRRSDLKGFIDPP